MHVSLFFFFHFYEVVLLDREEYPISCEKNAPIRWREPIYLCLMSWAWSHCPFTHSVEPIFHILGNSVTVTTYYTPLLLSVLLPFPHLFACLHVVCVPAGGSRGPWFYFKRPSPAANIKYITGLSQVGPEHLWPSLISHWSSASNNHIKTFPAVMSVAVLRSTCRHHRITHGAAVWVCRPTPVALGNWMIPSYKLRCHAPKINPQTSEN